MILKMLFELVLGLLELLFGWVSFPQLPSIVEQYLSNGLTYMANGMGFVWLIFPRDLVIVLLPIVLVLNNFDKLYTVTMWILRKIPFLNIQ